MTGVGTNIAAVDYNTIQSLIAPILGTGNAGYGQTVQSSQVSVNQLVTTAQWQALLNDITALNYHQLNAAPLYNVGSYPAYLAPSDPLYQSGQLAVPVNTKKVRDADRAAYLGVARGVTSYSSIAMNGVSYPGINNPVITGQSTTFTLPNPLVQNTNGWPVVGQRTANWGGVTSGVQTVTHTVIVSFPNAMAATYFFNTGSYITVAPSFSPSITNSKNTSWQTLLSSVGTLTFGRTGTTSSNNSGTQTSYGWNYFKANPTATQTIYSNGLGTAGSSLYAPNQYVVFCQLDNSGSKLTFTIQFQDLSSATSELAFKGGSNPFDVDEDVIGTLNSVVNLTYASGSYVSVSQYLPTPSSSGP